MQCSITHPFYLDRIVSTKKNNMISRESDRCSINLRTITWKFRLLSVELSAGMIIHPRTLYQSLSGHKYF